MKKAVYLGSPTHLQSAFSPETRREISGLVEILGDDIDVSCLGNRAADLAGAQIILSTWGMPKLDRNLLELVPRLEAVFYAAGSVKAFATPEAFAREIIIASAWGANAIPVAEYSIATILLSLKRFWNHTAWVRENQTFGRPFPVAGGYLSRVGLVSLGAIGKLVAARLQAFEMEVVAYDPFANADAAQTLGVQLLSLPEVFATSDVVSLHTPWIPETVQMIGGPLLSSMKPGATLINTSRGAILNEPQLCEVLARRSDLTAILDVTHPEPPVPGSPLYTLPNVCLTPHIAGSVGPEIARMGRWMADELRKYLAGDPLSHSVSQAMIATMA